MFGFLKRWFRSSAEKKLFIACRGDQELVERLVAHEVSRRPGLSRREAVRSAFERLKNDQR